MAIITVLLTLYLIFRSHTVQTLMVRLAADYMSKELNTTIRIAGFDISFRNGLVIEDIFVLDHQNDTLFKAKELAVRPGKFSLKNRALNVNKVFISHGQFQLLTHRGDSVLNLQHILDHFASTDTTPADTTPSKRWDLTVSAVELQNLHFRLHDYNTEIEPVGMDYAHLDIKNIYLDISDVSFDDFSVHATIKHLSAFERCGINLHHLAGSVQVGSRFMKASNLKIKTDSSDIKLDLDFLYDHWTAYNEFVDSVVIRAKLDTSLLNLSDIGFFAPELLTMTDKIRIGGYIRGTISNFKARDLYLSYGKTTIFEGNINMLGLPDIEETFADFNVRRLTTHREDIEAFRLPGNAPPIQLPDFLKEAGTINLKGKFTGFYNDFVSTAEVRSGLGKLATDIALYRQKGSNILGYKGKLKAVAFDLGTLLGSGELLGRTTFDAEMNGVGFSLGDASLKMALKVDSIFVNRYNYTKIMVEGELTDRQFDGKLNIDDPGLSLGFNGNIDLRDSIPSYDFDAKVNHADLFKLNLLTRDPLNAISTRLKVDIRGNSLDNLDGSLKIEETSYFEGNKVITMNKLSLLTRQDTITGKSYHLQSDFLDGDISGDFSFSMLVPSLADFIRGYLATFNLDSKFDFAENKNVGNPQSLDCRVLLKNTDEVTAVFLPILKVSPGTELKATYNEENEALLLKGNSEKILINDLELQNWYLDAETRLDNLSVATGAKSFILVRTESSDTTEIKLDSLLLLTDIHRDTIKYNISWSGLSRPSLIEGYVNFLNNPEVELKIEDFDVYLDNKYWGIDHTNKVVFDTSGILINNLAFLSEDQYLKVNGRISENLKDTLRLDFNKLDISKADALIGSSDINVDGILHGSVQLTNIYNDLMVLSDLEIKKFRFNNELLGDARFKIKYDERNSGLKVESNILYTGNVGTNIPFSLTGDVLLAGNKPEFDLKLSLKSLNLKMFNPFVKDFMSGLSGFATGEALIRGNAEKPVITGKLQFLRTQLKINYLNVPYSFADVVTIDTGAFIFNKITLFDSLGHKSVLNGKITHNYFSNLALDLHVDMDDFSAYNNTRSANSLFYGKARASGTASITGPVENLMIDVKATNGDKTHITIPIDLTRSVGETDFIIFKTLETDTLAQTGFNTYIKPEPTGLSLDLALRINDNAEIEVFFPEQLGNLKASGSGNLLMTMTPVSPFTLSGTYKLSKGFFLFQLKNYLRLPMSLLEGSSISWSGDPTDANVGISAVYKTKAPLKGLTTDPVLESTRIPVECIIRLGGKLMNPEIAFSLNLPNVEESIKSLVYSSIDTNNAITMTEQTFYLLVMNQFKPVVSTQGTIDMGSTAFSLVTNQINSMISQISNNVSVNMNYKPATNSTSQEFDVGISTQLFDDRLLIDGTFGMNNNSQTTAGQTSTIVGDINIEYILTKNRRWRVRAFNRTNTTNYLYNNAPYTQGVGIKYQRDFMTFRDFFGFGKKQ